MAAQQQRVGPGHDNHDPNLSLAVGLAVSLDDHNFLQVVTANQVETPNNPVNPDGTTATAAAAAAGLSSITSQPG
jgi:hypothetical protein